MSLAREEEKKNVFKDKKERKQWVCIRHSFRQKNVSLNGHYKNTRIDLERKEKENTEKINARFSFGFRKKLNEGHSSEGKVLSTL